MQYHPAYIGGIYGNLINRAAIDIGLPLIGRIPQFNQDRFRPNTLREIDVPDDDIRTQRIVLSYRQ